MPLYKYQSRQGRHFLHEHPWGADSWKLPSVIDVLEDGRVWGVQDDMCRFGMTSHIRERDGERGLVKKPTGFMTSSRFIAEELGMRCTGDHSHVHLEGGRASAAQVYPAQLCETIVQGVVKQKKAVRTTQVDMPRMQLGELRSC